MCACTHTHYSVLLLYTDWLLMTTYVQKTLPDFRPKQKWRFI